MSLRSQLSYGVSLLKQYGVHDLSLRVVEWVDSKRRSQKYNRIAANFLPTDKELSRQSSVHFDYEPLISIVMPAYETDPVFLRELLDSVLGQSYAKLELCIADGSKTDKVAKTLQEYSDSRIQYIKLAKNAGISDNTNEGFKGAHGDYIALLDHDDLLTKNALFEMVQALNTMSPRPDMIYSDEDKIIADTGILSAPAFKPDYNESFLRCNNYICHLLIFSRELLDKVGGLDSKYDGAQDFEFILRCSANGARIAHIPKILYHWRIHPASTSFDPGSKLYAYENGARAIEKYLAEMGEPGKASLTKDLGFYTIDYVLKGTFHVTVFAHSEQQVEQMKSLQAADPRIIVDYQLAANIDNQTLLSATGDYVVVTSRDAVPLTRNWLIQLLKIAQSKQVGMAAVKCLNKRKRIVSCGLAYDTTGQVFSFYEGLPSIFRGYCHRADALQNVSAASLAFAILKKQAIQGCKWDVDLPEPYRDADFCFQLADKGYSVVLNTDIHVQIGRKMAVERNVPQAFLRCHGERILKGDPFYSPNVLPNRGRFLL